MFHYCNSTCILFNWFALHFCSTGIFIWAKYSYQPWSTKQTNSVAFSPGANYTDWATATRRRNLVPTFVDRGVSRGQRGGSPTVVNLSFLDRALEQNDKTFSFMLTLTTNPVVQDI
jgi:hypothetical protein